jgi:putative redox protein
MAEVSIRWLTSQQFVGIDSTKHSVVLSSADEGVGMKPSDLLLIALAGCTAVDMVDILRKKRVELSSFDIAVSGEQDADPPWTFRKIHLSYRLGGKGLTEKAVEQAIKLSEEKYCSVAATVRGVAEITREYELLPE